MNAGRDVPWHSLAFAKLKYLFLSYFKTNKPASLYGAIPKARPVKRRNRKYNFLSSYFAPLSTLQRARRGRSSNTLSYQEGFGNGLGCPLYRRK